MVLFIPAAPVGTSLSRGRLSSLRCCSADGGVDGDTAPLPEVPGRRRLRGRVAYDGTNYNGWQLQPRVRTIQGEIELALHRRFSHSHSEEQQPLRVVGASRTDAGVHARGQAFHVDIPERLLCNQVDDLQRLQHVLNQMLPTDVRLSRLALAPYYLSRRDNEHHLWSAIYDTCGKVYSYRFSVGALPLDPLKRTYVHCEWRAGVHGFCEQRLRAAADRFVGTHDFSAFTNSLERKRRVVSVNPVRTIQAVRVSREGDAKEGIFCIEFTLSGALYKMVRNVVGTILDVACYQRDVESIDHLFESKDRKLVPKSAPAHGLCLEQVLYDDWPM